MSRLPLESFITRRHCSSYRGRRLELALSQSLFSSQEVDRGTQLLLKSLAHVSLPPRAVLLDVGSGTGVLGIALAASQEGSVACFQDRDALALAFTAHNCRANRIDPGNLLGELALQGLGEARFDLVVSNLPAKAGESVHADMLRRLGPHLASAM